jgi:hypothetical protein
LAYAPRYPAACGGNATESWRNRHIAFRESNKKPGRAAGFKFARKELPCFNLGIWRRPDTIAKIGKAEARGARFGHIALSLIAAIGLMMLLR